MSVSDDADDFVRWLKAARPRRVLNWTRDDFAPRRTSPTTCRPKVSELAARDQLNVTWVQASVRLRDPRGRGWEVVLSHGEPMRADIVVLATGNETPRPLGPNLPPQAQRLIIKDPWDTAQKSRHPERRSGAARRHRPHGRRHRHGAAPSRPHGSDPCVLTSRSAAALARPRRDLARRISVRRLPSSLREVVRARAQG